jgi:hypothetical protein
MQCTASIILLAWAQPPAWYESSLGSLHGEMLKSGALDRERRLTPRTGESFKLYYLIEGQVN